MYAIAASYAALFRMTARTENDLALKLGVAIRKHRRAQGLSQLKLAELVDCHINCVGCIERGTRRLSLDMLSRFLNALHISLQDLARMARV